MKKRGARRSKVVESEDEEDAFVGGLDGAVDDDDGMICWNQFQCYG